VLIWRLCRISSDVSDWVTTSSGNVAGDVLVDTTPIDVPQVHTLDHQQDSVGNAIAPVPQSREQVTVDRSAEPERRPTGQTDAATSSGALLPSATMDISVDDAVPGSHNVAIQRLFLQRSRASRETALAPSDELMNAR
jgi:hypothetical protein